MFHTRLIKNAMHPNGKYELTCPKCGRKYAFFFYQEYKNCMLCDEKLPDVKELINSVEARANYHKGEDNE